MDNVDARRVGAAFEALLLQMVLKPLAHSESVLGEYGTACIAENLARSDARGFGAIVARQLEGGHD